MTGLEQKGKKGLKQCELQLCNVIVNILRDYWKEFKIHLHQYMLSINILNMHALPSLSSPCGAVLKLIAL